jgi:uncharacterized protein
MKIANYVIYVDPPENVESLRPAHCEYQAQLLADGRLVINGPFSDGSGALLIYAAEEIVAADPDKTGGTFRRGTHARQLRCTHRVTARQVVQKP